MKFHSTFFVFALLALLSILVPDIAFADLRSSLDNVRSQLTVVVLPTLSVIGIAIAAISFFTGNPNSKQHIFYAIMGCVFGFGAQAIVDFIAQAVH